MIIDVLLFIVLLLKSGKVVYSKHSKHSPYTMAHKILSKQQSDHSYPFWITAYYDT